MKPSVSVCMATYNGSDYIREQLDSILPQLNDDDEIVISDDHSSDDTIERIKALGDPRIKIFYNTGEQGFTSNFENALKHATKPIIFLSDLQSHLLHGASGRRIRSGSPRCRHRRREQKRFTRLFLPCEACSSNAHRQSCQIRIFGMLHGFQTQDSGSSSTVSDESQMLSPR